MYSKKIGMGFLLGIAVPLFMSILWYQLLFSNKGISLLAYYQHFIDKSSITNKLYFMALVSEIPLFMYFYNRKRDDELRGIIIALFLLFSLALYHILIK